MPSPGSTASQTDICVLPVCHPPRSCVSLDSYHGYHCVVQSGQDIRRGRGPLRQPHDLATPQTTSSIPNSHAVFGEVTEAGFSSSQWALLNQRRIGSTKSIPATIAPSETTQLFDKTTHARNCSSLSHLSGRRGVTALMKPPKSFRPSTRRPRSIFKSAQNATNVSNSRIPKDYGSISPTLSTAPRSSSGSRSPLADAQGSRSPLEDAHGSRSPLADAQLAVPPVVLVNGSLNGNLVDHNETDSLLLNTDILDLEETTDVRVHNNNNNNNHVGESKTLISGLSEFNPMFINLGTKLLHSSSRTSEISQQISTDDEHGLYPRRSHSKNRTFHRRGSLVKSKNHSLNPKLGKTKRKCKRKNDSSKHSKTVTIVVNGVNDTKHPHPSNLHRITDGVNNHVSRTKHRRELRPIENRKANGLSSPSRGIYDRRVSNGGWVSSV